VHFFLQIKAKSGSRAFCRTRSKSDDFLCEMVMSSSKLYFIWLITLFILSVLDVRVFAFFVWPFPSSTALSPAILSRTALFALTWLICVNHIILVLGVVALPFLFSTFQ